MDSSGVSKEQKVPRPLTLLMNWGYRVCSGENKAGTKVCYLVAASSVIVVLQMNPRVRPLDLFRDWQDHCEVQSSGSRDI